MLDQRRHLVEQVGIVAQAGLLARRGVPVVPELYSQKAGDASSVSATAASVRSS
jgi:hypothetical protein